MRGRPPAWLALLLAAGGVNAADEPPKAEAAVELQTVEVIGVTPLPGVGLPPEQVPVNIQQLDATAIRRAAAPSLGQLLERDIGSVNINEAQENLFEPDVNYRGFTASPLLGTPEGLSVYVDGVRANEAFGDIVNWDYIPQLAIRKATIVPGSNPLFGLNTLGGSINLNTKSGFDSRGFAVSLDGGSFGRRQAQAEGGGRFGALGLYGATTIFDESGWRDHSYSRVRQIFGRADWRPASGTRASLSYTGALNRLAGTQALPADWLDQPQRAYTWPDFERNQLGFFNLNLERDLDEGDAIDVGNLLRANLYYRKSRTHGFNSNTDDDFDPTQPPDPVANPPADNELNTIKTRSYGATLEFSSYAPVFGRPNLLTIGVADDLAGTDFRQDTQPAEFVADRETLGTGPFTLTTLLNARDDFRSAYFNETLRLTDPLSLNLGGRYTHARIRLADNGSPGAAGPGSLSGSHGFNRFNPTGGLTYSFSAQLNAYATYNESERVPSPIELTCADPDAPCRLPNDFLADPELKPVVARTVETGVRGSLRGIDWSAALFRTTLFNDILFVASGGATNAGFFQNVPRTRRQGLELGASGKIRRLEWSLHYSYIDATYRSGFSESSPDNSSADAGGDIRIAPGARIPGIPRHNLKLRADYALTPELEIGASLKTYSAQFPRGDENNGDFRGAVQGYTLLSLDARYTPAPGWQLYVSVDNALDRAYQTLGVLGNQAFAGAHTNAPNLAADRSTQFRSPGAPIGAWGGVRYSFSP